jgi:peptidoglycan/LPS O-acetylase OafA/YrhL
MPAPATIETGEVVAARVSSGRRNFGLDAMRALAISLVLACHIIQPWESSGVIGVELFYALSGYLIGRILIRMDASIESFGSSALWTFWLRRWMRTLPAYYLCLFILVALNAPGQGESYLGRLLKYGFFLQNFAWSPPWFFAVSWSLSVEEWFYLLFPLAVFFSRRILPKRTAWWSAVLFFILVPFLLRVIVGPGDSWDQNIRKVVIFRLDALMFGVAMALIQITAQEYWQRLASMAGKLALAALVFAASFLTVVRASAPQALPVALCFTVLPLLFALSLPWWLRLRDPGGWAGWSIRRLSLYSYIVYLCHAPILDAFHAQVVRFGGGLGLQVGADLIALAVIVVFAALVHHWYEKPIMDRRPSVLR